MKLTAGNVKMKILCGSIHGKILLPGHWLALVK